jgi:hypothetical protein
MGWGFFKKIGQGLKKAFKFVKDKIVEPVAKVVKKTVAPIYNVAKPIINKVIPGGAAATAIIDKAAGVVGKFV